MGVEHQLGALCFAAGCCGDRRLDRDVTRLRSAGAGGQGHAGAGIEGGGDRAGGDHGAVAGGEVVAGEPGDIEIRPRGIHREVVGIQQPGAALAIKRRGIRRPAHRQLLLAGGFHEATITALATATGADRPIHLSGPIGPHHHRAALPLLRGIGPDRAGAIHQGGLGVRHRPIAPLQASAHQHRSAAGRAAGIEGGAREGDPIARDLDAAPLARRATGR